MNCVRSSPATGGSGRRFTAAARSRNRASISSTSNVAIEGDSTRQDPSLRRVRLTVALATVGRRVHGTVRRDGRFLHRGRTVLRGGLGLGTARRRRVGTLTGNDGIRHRAVRVLGARRRRVGTLTGEGGNGY